MRKRTDSPADDRPRCVQFARGKNDGQDYAIKFFTMREAFEREDALYSNKVRTTCSCLLEWIRNKHIAAQVLSWSARCVKLSSMRM